MNWYSWPKPLGTKPLSSGMMMDILWTLATKGPCTAGFLVSHVRSLRRYTAYELDIRLGRFLEQWEAGSPNAPPLSRHADGWFIDF